MNNHYVSNKPYKFMRGFTIVELLVVIGVIGILATITIVAYGSWQKTTISNQLKSDLNGAAAAMENARTFGNKYPLTVPSTFTPSDGVTLQGGSSDGRTYCISVISTKAPGLVYHIDQSSGVGEASPGECAIMVTTLAGSIQGFADGTGTSAQFHSPIGIVVDSAGTVYMTDQVNNRIRKVAPTGVVTTLAGSGTAGYTDGTGTSAQFYYPSDVTVDSAGTVYVVDQMNNRIRKVTPTGVVTTLAGSGTAGYTDGTGTSAQFNYPSSIAVDSAGTVYVTDKQNHRIRKITPAGVVTTWAGSGTAGYADGTGTSAQFNSPSGIAVDSTDTVYVVDQMNNRIRKVTPAGVVTTLAGSGTAGYVNGTGTSARFNSPSGIAVDSAGTVYVADTYNNRIREITPAGVVTTLAGSGTAGYVDGTDVSAQFYYPADVAVDSAGTVYMTDQWNNRIRKIR